MVGFNKDNEGLCVKMNSDSYVGGKNQAGGDGGRVDR